MTSGTKIIECQQQKKATSQQWPRIELLVWVAGAQCPLDNHILSQFFICTSCVVARSQAPWVWFPEIADFLLYFCFYLQLSQDVPCNYTCEYSSVLTQLRSMQGLPQPAIVASQHNSWGWSTSLSTRIPQNPKRSLTGWQHHRRNADNIQLLRKLHGNLFNTHSVTCHSHME